MSKCYAQTERGPCLPVRPWHPKRPQCQCRNNDPRTHADLLNFVNCGGDKKKSDPGSQDPNILQVWLTATAASAWLPFLAKLSQFAGKSGFSNTTFVTSAHDTKSARSLTMGIKTRCLNAQQSQATRHGIATRVTHPRDVFNKYISDRSRQEDGTKPSKLIIYIKLWVFG